MCVVRLVKQTKRGFVPNLLGPGGKKTDYPSQEWRSHGIKQVHVYM